MGQHTNVTPMTPEQRRAYAAQLRVLATPEAQAGARDPVVAAEFVARLAERYEVCHTTPEPPETQRSHSGRDSGLTR